jgi:uncharacterized membrane protein
VTSRTPHIAGASRASQSASGVIWVAALIPIEVMQARMAKRFATEAVIPARYWRLSTLWFVFGAVATLLPLANLYFMVFKPG